MADNNRSVCLSFFEFVTNGIRQCFGLENVHSGSAAPAGTSDNAKPLIPENKEEEAPPIVSISEEISTTTYYNPPVIADQETPSTENNDLPPSSPPPAVKVLAAPPPRLQTVTRGSGPKTN